MDVVGAAEMRRLWDECMAAAQSPAELWLLLEEAVAARLMTAYRAPTEDRE